MDFLLITKRYLIAINFCQKLFLQVTVEQNRRTSEGWRLGWLVSWMQRNSEWNENWVFILKWLFSNQNWFKVWNLFHGLSIPWKIVFEKNIVFLYDTFHLFTWGWGSWNGIWSLNWLLNQLNILLTLGLIIIIIFDLLKCPCVSYK